jgi:hypothetical protein
VRARRTNAFWRYRFEGHEQFPVRIGAIPMSLPPIRKRKFDAFLSHAHLDKAVVDSIYHWLTDTSGVAVWYDATHLPPSASIATSLPQAIVECRGMIIAVSKASLQSGWVQEEYNAAMAQRTTFRDYRIIPLRLDDSPVPHFLQTTKWIDLVDGKITLATANELLASLYGEELSIEPGKSRDVYISRTWRESETSLADSVCKILAKRELRLIGDSKDQAGFGEGERVRSIISSCGAMVAVLPDRGGGNTSEYMLKEIAIGRDLGLACFVVAEPNVSVPSSLESITVHVTAEALDQIDALERAVIHGVDRIDEEWQKPRQAHYVFFATVVGNEYSARNRVLRQVVERVTAMPCIMGDDIREGQIQQVIIDLIRRAFFVIADISEENLNTCVEAGVALGAGRRLHLVAAAPRHRPPFIFRDQQVWHYGDDADLVGRVHRIAYPYRRRVLNGEVSR